MAPIYFETNPGESYRDCPSCMEGDRAMNSFEISAFLSLSPTCRGFQTLLDPGTAASAELRWKMLVVRTTQDLRVNARLLQVCIWWDLSKGGFGCLDLPLSG